MPKMAFNACIYVTKSHRSSLLSIKGSQTSGSHGDTYTPKPKFRCLNLLAESTPFLGDFLSWQLHCIMFKRSQRTFFPFNFQSTHKHIYTFGLYNILAANYNCNSSKICFLLFLLILLPGNSLRTLKSCAIRNTEYTFSMTIDFYAIITFFHSPFQVKPFECI